MVDPNLIIDDAYITDVGKYCVKRGNQLEDILDEYVVILREIKNEAIMQGEISETLQEFIECVSLLNRQVLEMSRNTKVVCTNFVSDIDKADSFLF